MSDRTWSDRELKRGWAAAARQNRGPDVLHQNSATCGRFREGVCYTLAWAGLAYSGTCARSAWRLCETMALENALGRGHKPRLNGNW